eukprot:CAMPEP_0119420434 /NCGR_PEP_ID=MMETSP1335-20130426/23498_1 /TAXON_ID=259385 /ORGANISM="Chrysoculter rhomboideus, Strain RCC1486" /LENGTH=57 /DNA_ID=CAMNT_0007445789 /DNA_START=28 /DNA_END=198 /DNA_ORIENTATION=+
MTMQMNERSGGSDSTNDSTYCTMPTCWSDCSVVASCSAAARIVSSCTSSSARLSTYV